MPIRYRNLFVDAIRLRHLQTCAEFARVWDRGCPRPVAPSFTPATRPKVRTLDMFRQWFDVDFAPVVFDLVEDEPLET